MLAWLQAERARRIEEKRQQRKYDRQMARRQEYVSRCREELEERRRKVSIPPGAASAHDVIMLSLHSWHVQSVYMLVIGRTVLCRLLSVVTVGLFATTFLIWC